MKPLIVTIPVSQFTESNFELMVLPKAFTMRCRNPDAGRLNISFPLFARVNATSGVARATRRNSVVMLRNSVLSDFRNLRRAGIV